MTDRNPIRLVLLAVLAAALPAEAARAAGTAAQTADEILRLSGVRGGLIVHLGCRTGELTGALAGRERFLVHGLDAQAGNVAKAREQLGKLGLGARASVEPWTAVRLPYVDNLVNLVVVEDAGGVPMAEVLRVLAPGGAACVARDGGWAVSVKPRPKTIDEWTHFLHGPDGNAVSQDQVVGPPACAQWVAAPAWARSHEHLASISAVVTSGGRIFSIDDEAPAASVTLPPQWRLVARDAFNGLTLWKQPIGPWAPHLRRFRTGPAQLPRQLVAVGNTVYCTPGLGRPVTAFDAATGKTLRTYGQTQAAEEILCLDGTLLVVADPAGTGTIPEVPATREAPLDPPAARLVIALRADSGEVLWQAKTQRYWPLSLAAAGGKVFFKDDKAVRALSLADGKPLWRSAPLEDPKQAKIGSYAVTLVARKDAVLFADGDKLVGLSAETGKELWAGESQLGFHSPVDVLVADGLVWTGKISSAKLPGFNQGRDPLTGEVKRTIPTDPAFLQVGMPHHRCYRNKATETHILAGKAGIEFIDLKTGQALLHHWVRGECQYGILPANGLLYAPSHSCACYQQAKLSGFWALAPARAADAAAEKEERLQKGPAYEQAPAPAKGEGDDWPTYRGNPQRSGATRQTLPAALRTAWKTDVGGKLTAVTVADGKLFIAAADAHTLYALNLTDGKVAWQFTAGGRIDSPPTLYQGLAIFGCRDGYVYCLRASDGTPVWRFRAAPEDRRIVAFGQLESVWPVHGNVLVLDGQAYFAAGRSSYIDGGIHLFRLEAVGGKVLSRTVLYSPDPKTHRQPPVQWFDMPGAMPDVLSTDGQFLYMRQVKLSRDLIEQAQSGRHLFSMTGFLDDAWWHRTYWVLSDVWSAGWAGWFRAGNEAPAGRILSYDADGVYGFGRDRYFNNFSWGGWTNYRLFATGNPPEILAAPAGKVTQPAQPRTADTKDQAAARRGAGPQSKVRARWTQHPPILVRAMVLADKTLFIAGPPALPDSDPRATGALEGKAGASLLAVATADGATRAQLKFDAMPVFDGLAAAGGRLYLALADGSVICLVGK